MANSLILEAVRERDVDLLLVEELQCNPFAQRFLFDTLWPDLPYPPDIEIQVRHSVSGFDDGISPGIAADLITRRGETDIAVRYSWFTDGRPVTHVALLENKIDANFTELQPERYTSRAQRLERSEGVNSSVRCLLTAPESYLRSPKAAAFHATLSYEQWAAFFDRLIADGDGDELTRRWQYRKYMLLHASEQFRRKGVTVVHEGVSRFRQQYHAYVMQVAPTLGMRSPNKGGQWAGDVWMEFDDAFAPKPAIRGEIKHKCPDGRVDLQLAGWAAFETQISAQLDSRLEAGMQRRKAEKSLAVSIAVSAFNPQSDFAKYYAEVQEGVAAALRLQSWYRTHRTWLEQTAAELRLFTPADNPVA